MKEKMLVSGSSSRHQRVPGRPILLIGPLPPPHGGVSIHMGRLSRRLGKAMVDHAVLDESRQRTVGVANVRDLSLVAYIGFVRQFPVLHIHSSNHFVRLFHTVIARSLGLKIIHTVHSARGSWGAMAALRLATWLGHVRIAVSAEVARSLGGNSQVIPAFIPPSMEEEGIPVELVDWINDQKVAGRSVIAANASNTAKIGDVDIYGLDLIVAAFQNSMVRENFSALICVSSTDPNPRYFQGLSDRMAKCGLMDRVRFVTTPVSFAGVVQRCDVFIRPTATDGDAISLREALWYNKPAIASDIVERPAGAILFESRDIEKMITRILEMRSTAKAEGVGADFTNDILKAYSCPDLLL